MKKELFRKKNLEKISSPEKVDDYINAVSINSWMIAAACFIVILGLITWGIFGKVEISKKTVTVCKNKEAICFIEENSIEDISEETEFCINGNYFNAETVSDIPSKVSDILTEYEAHIAGFEEDDWVYTVKIDSDLSDGAYETEVITKSISPIFLLMN